MASRSRLSSMGRDSDSRYLLLHCFLRIFAYEKNQISGFIIISTTLEKHSLVSQTKMRKNSSENFSRSTEYEEKQPSIFSDLAEKTSSRQYNSKTISSSPQFLVSGRRQLRRSSWIWRDLSISLSIHPHREQSREIHRIWPSSHHLSRWGMTSLESKRSSRVSTHRSHSRSARSKPSRDLRNNYEFSGL